MQRGTQAFLYPIPNLTAAKVAVKVMPTMGNIQSLPEVHLPPPDQAAQEHGQSLTWVIRDPHWNQLYPKPQTTPSAFLNPCPQ